MTWLFWILAAYALGCPTSVDEVVDELIKRGDVPAYHCMVARADAESVLVQRIPLAGEQTQPRLRRALVFTLLKENELPWTPETVALLSPADRRLLADGVKAKRGRKSPSELHHRIFENWDWYRPKLGYTDNILKPVDRANISIADDPTGAKTQPMTEPVAPVVPNPEAQSGCGCTAAGVSPVGWGVLAMTLGVASLRRRLRT